MRLQLRFQPNFSVHLFHPAAGDPIKVTSRLAPQRDDALAINLLGLTIDPLNYAVLD
jgi:hypothetical protein